MPLPLHGLIRKLGARPCHTDSHRLPIAHRPQPTRPARRAPRTAAVGFWDQHCRDLVYHGNLLKFSQHKKLRAQLLATGDLVLAEAARVTTDRPTYSTSRTDHQRPTYSTLLRFPSVSLFVVHHLHYKPAAAGLALPLTFGSYVQMSTRAYLRLTSTSRPWFTRRTTRSGALG